MLAFDIIDRVSQCTVLKEPTLVLEQAMLLSHVCDPSAGLCESIWCRWNRRSMLGDTPCASNHTPSTVLLYLLLAGVQATLELVYTLGGQPLALHQAACDETLPYPFPPLSSNYAPLCRHLSRWSWRTRWATSPLHYIKQDVTRAYPTLCLLLSPDHAPAQAFEPLELAQHAGRPALRFPTFDAALDEYFSKVRCHTASVGVACRSSGVALHSVWVRSLLAASWPMLLPGF